MAAMRVVDLGPLLRGAGAEDVRIGGVALGEPAAGIDGTVVDETVSEDGVLRCGDAALVVRDGIVAEMHEDGTLTAMSEEWYGMDLTTQQ